MYRVFLPINLEESGLDRLCLAQVDEKILELPRQPIYHTANIKIVFPKKQFIKSYFRDLETVIHVALIIVFLNLAYLLFKTTTQF